MSRNQPETNPRRDSYCTIPEFTERNYQYLKWLLKAEHIELDWLPGWIGEGIVEFRIRVASAIERSEFDNNWLSPQTVLHASAIVRRVVDRERRKEARIRERFSNRDCDSVPCPSSTTLDFEGIDSLDLVRAFRTQLPDNLIETFDLWVFAARMTGQRPKSEEMAEALHIKANSYRIRLMRIIQFYDQFAGERDLPLW